MAMHHRPTREQQYHPPRTEPGFWLHDLPALATIQRTIMAIDGWVPSGHGHGVCMCVRARACTCACKLGTITHHWAALILSGHSTPAECPSAAYN